MFVFLLFKLTSSYLFASTLDCCSVIYNSINYFQVCDHLLASHSLQHILDIVCARLNIHNPMFQIRKLIAIHLFNCAGSCQIQQSEISGVPCHKTLVTTFSYDSVNFFGLKVILYTASPSDK